MSWGGWANALGGFVWEMDKMNIRVEYSEIIQWR